MPETMRIDLDYLPVRKQRELKRVVEILHEELQIALGEAESAQKKKGCILKIVLFGSYARNEWVDEPHTTKGYQSDYDLLVVVNYKVIAELNECWYKAEDKLMHDPAIKTPVSIIVHTLTDVNNKLKQGQYFFSDIVKEGVLLYDLKGSRLFAAPQPVTPQDALETAQKHYDKWMPSVIRRQEVFRYELSRAADNKNWRNDAAFTLHQTVERLYSCILLVLTNYAPSTHNIKYLRALCEDLDSRLIDIWPRRTRIERRRFSRLKRAYIEARYSPHYEITAEDLDWLGERAQDLQRLADIVCKERLAALAKEANA